MSKLNGIKGVVASEFVLEHVAELLDQHKREKEEKIAKAAKLVAAKSRTRILGIFPRKILTEEEVERLIRTGNDAPWWWSFANGLWPTMGMRVCISGGYSMTVKELQSIAWLAAKASSTVELDGRICRSLGLLLDPKK